MWHEARRSERKVHEMMDAARKRAERRASFLAKRRGDPLQHMKLTGARCRLFHDQAMYQAAQDLHGLIPWNGQNDNLIDRFDGRALLDFIRDDDAKARERRNSKTEEEEELEELVNFERYRDLIKRRRRGFSDELGGDEEDASKAFNSSARKGTYSQVAYSYGNDKSRTEDNDAAETSSEDSQYEEEIGKDHGIHRFRWLSYMDKHPGHLKDSTTKSSRRERRSSSSRYSRGSRRSSDYSSRRDRSRSRSRSSSPRRASDRKEASTEGKIEYITEFIGDDEGTRKTRGSSPPPSPPSQVDKTNRKLAGSGRIFEALSSTKDNSRPPLVSDTATNALAKLNKPAVPLYKTPTGEINKETPQERLKRIMSKQLNKQIKKDHMSTSKRY